MEKLTKILTIISDGQKTFGKEINVRDIFNYYRLKMEDRFSVEQVIKALKEYTDKKNDIPAPADLINIIDPPKRKITYQEYCQACEQHRLEGYPQFGYYKQIINEYTGEEETPKETFKLENDKVKYLIDNYVNRI
jgi:hypothetical protein